MALNTKVESLAPIKLGRLGNLLLTPPRAPKAPLMAPAPEAIAVAPRSVRPVRPTVSAEEAAARQAQAEANAREVARLQEITRQEKAQEVRLVAIRQRQAIQQAAAEAQSRVAARRLAQAQATEAKQNAAKAAATEVAVESVSASAEEAAAPYTVRKGDTLPKLARAHHVTVAQLLAWNDLEVARVVPGQQLVLSEPTEVAEATPPRKQPKSTTKISVAAAPAATSRPSLDKRLEKPQVHLVQPGDTLFNISRRFGVSVKMLRELNHLTSDDVKLGQKLLVPQG
jgi:membrane-bound lytic murein transglycosylase D